MCGWMCSWMELGKLLLLLIGIASFGHESILYVRETPTRLHTNIVAVYINFLLVIRRGINRRYGRFRFARSTARYNLMRHQEGFINCFIVGLILN